MVLYKSGYFMIYIVSALMVYYLLCFVRVIFSSERYSRISAILYLAGAVIMGLLIYLGIV